MENKMETTIVYWVCVGIMENKMEATIITAVICPIMVFRKDVDMSFVEPELPSLDLEEVLLKLE